MKRLLLLLLLVGAIGVIGASGQYKRITGSMVVTYLTTDLADTLRYVLIEGIASTDIDDSSWYVDTILGDSIAYVTPAKVIKITPTVLMDSFSYFDSVDGTVDAGADTVIYNSPVYIMYLTPIYDTSLTYELNVVFASTDEVGFDFDAGSAGATIDNLAELIDSLIDSLTAYTDITDSIAFHDSVTYIKVIARFATETHGGRWRIQSDPILDPTMSPRTGGRLVQTVSAKNVTVAIICDTFTALHNKQTTTKDSILATDYGTYFTLSTKIGNQDNTDNLPNGWSVTMWGQSGSGADADSAWDTTTTVAATIPSVINGLVAAINATITVKDTVEAINTGDTAYYLISRRHKQNFLNMPDDRFTDPDTTEDKEGVSAVTDSIWIGTVDGYQTILAKLRIGQATGHDNLGENDSAKILLSTSSPAGTWMIDSLSNVTIPLVGQFVVGHLLGDSTLGFDLYFKYHYMDTVSDTAGVVISIPLSWDILLK